MQHLEVRIAADPRPVLETGGRSAQSTKAPASPAGSSKLTRANFEQIQNGMTEGQVTAIFGPPQGSASNTTTMEGNTVRSKTLTWRQSNPKITVTVTFRNEKVAGKNWLQITPLQPAAPAPPAVE